jgi:DNA-binding NarL/FixJ family response regulator
MAEKLSERESQVLELLAFGLSPEQIGKRLQLSPHAVRVFLENAWLKLHNDL